MNRYLFTYLSVLMFFSLPVFAVDGVIEINEARALAGGVTPGDTPGYPVTINQSGSYRLTGNLNQPNPSIDVIKILANDVTLDMNGFTIKGGSFCTRNTSSGVVTCSYGAAEIGVGISSLGALRVTIRNGNIVGTASHGIAASGGIVDVHNVTIEHCDGYGMNDVTNVDRANVRLNRQDGIFTTTGIVTNSRASENGLIGITCLSCTGNIAINNFTGISVRDGGLAERNVVMNNKNLGILGGLGSLLSSNTIRLNGMGLTGATAVYQGNVLTNNTTNFGSAVVKSSDNFCESVACP
jgi:hypothetical protein